MLKSIPLEEYAEIHHILPRSLGGSDEKRNLVRLTAREHFICHALLAEMYDEESVEWYKMNHAFLMMRPNNNNRPRYLSSRLYERKREDFSKVMSHLQMGKKNSQYGTCWISNFKSRECKKVDLKEVDQYMQEGWHRRRVLNFSIYTEEGKRRPTVKQLREKKRREGYVYRGKEVNTNRRNGIRDSFGVNVEEDFLEKMSKLEERLRSKYINQKKSLHEIAREYRMNSETLRHYLEFFEIKRRSISEANKIWANGRNG